ncbi:MAG: type IV pilus assembly protein PilM [Clostridium sp.]
MWFDARKKGNNMNLLKEKEEPQKKSILQIDIKDLRKYLADKTKDRKKQSPKRNANHKKKVVAFDIGTTTIKIAQGTYNEGKLSVDTCIKINTPLNSVKDGEIVNRNELYSVIHEAMKKNNIKAKYAICTTSPTSIISREITVPKVEEDELETVVRYEIQQYLSIDFNEYTLQINVLSEVQDEFDEKTNLNVRVVAYPKRVSLEYYNLLTDLNLKPYALDVNFNALNKIVNLSEMTDSEQGENSTIAFIDIGASFIDVNIYKGKELDFTRRIKSGGKDIDERLISERICSSKNTEKIKEDIDLSQIYNLKPGTDIVKEVLDDWVEKIEMILQFYRNKDIENNITKIVLMGGSSNLKGLPKYLSERLGINIFTLSSLSNIIFKNPDFNGSLLSDYMNVIGSLIRI